MRALDRILVRIPNWLGDALMARPLLHAVRAAHPRAEILAVGPRMLLELLSTERTFDLSQPGPGAPVPRRFRPQVALVLPPSFSSAWLAWRSGAAMRIGYRHEGRGPLLTHAFRRPARGDLHLSREYLALGSPIGAQAVPVRTLEPPHETRESIATLMSRVGAGEGPLAILGPGAIYGPAKRWDPSRFAALGRVLTARGMRVLVCGGASERDTCSQVAREIGPGAVMLAGVTSLAEQAALCARAALAVCNDSGLAHLAAASGAPTVAIFGSTSSAWTAPLGARVRVVQRAPVCSPCFLRTCRIGTRCLVAVEVRDVVRACDEVAA